MDHAWRRQGKCRKIDPEVFYPPDGLGVAQAQAICATCPVVDACAEWGIAHEEYGVWGGLSERQRRRIRRQRRIRRPPNPVRTRGVA